MNIVRTLFFRVALLALLTVCLPAASYAGPVIGTFDGTRATTANVAAGFFTFQARASLASHFPGYSFATDLILTDEFFSGIDMLLITSSKSGATPVASLSANEQASMYSFVLGGGTALLLADGDSTLLPAAQSMVAPFGMSVTHQEFPLGPFANPTDLTHPIISGPYGDTTSIRIAGYSSFSDLGPYAHVIATQVTTGFPVAAVIEAGALGPHSGRVVLITDTWLFKDQGTGRFLDNQTFFLNTVQFLVPEPSSFVLAGFAWSTITLVAFRQRAKR